MPQGMPPGMPPAMGWPPMQPRHHQQQQQGGRQSPMQQLAHQQQRMQLQPSQAPAGRGAFSFAPGSITSALSRDGMNNGAINALESLAAPGTMPCAWKALKGSCTKPNCKRCASGDVFPPAAVARTKGAYAPGLVF